MSIARIVKRTVGGFVLLVFVAIAVLAIRLSQGPIEMDRLKPYVVRALTPADGAYRVEIGKTVIAWEGWDEGLRIRAEDVHFTRADGSDMARLPAISARVVPGALLAGDVAVKSLTVLRPRLVLVRHSDGRIDLGLPKGSRMAESTPVMNGVLRALARERREEGPLGALESVRIVDGDLTIEDATLGRTWSTRNLTATLTRDGDGIRASLLFDLQVAERSVNFAAAGNYRRTDGSVSLSLRFNDLAPSLFASAKGPMRALTWFDSTLAGEIGLSLKADGKLDEIDFRLKGGRGKIAVPGWYEPPLPVVSLALAGRVYDGYRAIDVSEARVEFGGPVLQASATVRPDGEGLRLRGTFSLAQFAATDIARYWPMLAKPAGRKWVQENILAGRVPQLDVRLDMLRSAAGDFALERLQGAFSYKDLTVRFQKLLPPVTKVSGFATFDDRDLKFAIESGELEGVKLRNGRVEILGFEKPAEDFIVVAPIEGSLTDVLKILDRKPLEFAQALGISPLAVSAEAKGTLTVRFLLSEHVALDSIDISAEADLSKLLWRKGLFGLDIADGRFKLSVSKKGMLLAGDARLGPEPATIRWTENFAKNANPQREVDVKTRFAPETLAQVGLDIRQHMTGPFGAEIKIVSAADGRTTIDGTYDFKDAAFTLPGLPITKPRGMAANGRSLVQLQSLRIVAVPRFELNSPVVRASGSATFHPDGATIRTMELTQLVAGRTNLRASIQGERDGRKVARVEGAALDLVPILANRTESGDVVLPPLKISARVARLYTAPQRQLSDVRGEAEYDGTTWRVLGLDAQAAPGATLSLRLAPSENGRSLKIAASDAGAALKALNVADTIVGGKIDIAALADARNPGAGFAGHARMTGFRVIRAPVMARLLALASFDGLANLLATDAGVSFDEMVVPFRFRDGLVEMREAQVVGQHIGITATGRLDFRRDTADLAGSIAPAYMLNSLVGRLPGIGQLIVGERGGALLAVRYTLKGNLSSPDFTVHPLSMLAPAPLRRMVAPDPPQVDRDRKPIAPTPPPSAGQDERDNLRGN